MNNVATAASTPVFYQLSQKNTGFINKRIGNTMYRVSVNFSETSKERLEDKILRLVQNDVISIREVV